jgi:hypothetical protein
MLIYLIHLSVCQRGPSRFKCNLIFGDISFILYGNLNLGRIRHTVLEAQVELRDFF